MQVQSRRWCGSDSQFSLRSTPPAPGSRRGNPLEEVHQVGRQHHEPAWTAANTPSRRLYAKLPSSAITHTTRSGSGCFRQRGLEVGVVECAEQYLGVAVRVDYHQGWLRRNAESSENDSGVVADLGKRQRVLVYEALERSIIASPRDADEIDPAGPLLRRCFDRGSFCVAHASSRRPKPKCGRAASALSSIEVATPNERCRELQQFRNVDRVATLGSDDGCLTRSQH